MTCSKIRNHVLGSHKHLHANLKDPLCREFNLPRVTDARTFLLRGNRGTINIFETQHNHIRRVNDTFVTSDCHLYTQHTSLDLFYKRVNYKNKIDKKYAKSNTTVILIKYTIEAKAYN